MSKYEPLWKYLEDNNKEKYILSYEEIKNILGFEINHSFLTYKKEAKEYGYEVGKISMKERTVIFNRSFYYKFQFIVEWPIRLTILSGFFLMPKTHCFLSNKTEIQARSLLSLPRQIKALSHPNSATLPLPKG